VDGGGLKHVEKAVFWQVWERCKTMQAYTEKPDPGVFANTENWDQGQRSLRFDCLCLLYLCISQEMSTVLGIYSGRRTFKWQLCHLLKVSISVQLCGGNLALLWRRMWLGWQPCDGMVQRAQTGVETVAALVPFRSRGLFCGLDTLVTPGAEKLEANLAKGSCTSSWRKQVGLDYSLEWLLSPSGVGKSRAGSQTLGRAVPALWTDCCLLFSQSLFTSRPCCSASWASSLFMWAQWLLLLCTTSGKSRLFTRIAFLFLFILRGATLQCIWGEGGS